MNLLQPMRLVAFWSCHVGLLRSMMKLESLVTRSFGAILFARRRGQFIAQQCSQFFAADRTDRLLPNQRAQMRDAMATWQRLHSADHDRSRGRHHSPND